ncbi:MAG: DMT family transporter [Acidimicrobiia bacterium]|nr:DMT family transporter [Acidimicrobiia bacterium]NND13828.1 EamA family transporter [Acidimicrobiia bacterium]NNL29013.1 EamA family transporter [Acidimicrobiia bacterium]
MNRLITTSHGSNAQAFSPSDWALLAVPALIWGASFYLIAVALESFPPQIVTLGRIAFGFLALSGLRKVRVPIDPADRSRFLLLGVLWMAFPFAMFSFSEQWIDSAVAGMLNAGTPIFAMLVGSLLLKTMPRLVQIGGVILGTIGIGLISLPSLGEGSVSALGVAMVISANVSYGFAINLAVPLQQKYGGLPTIWRTQMVALALWLIPGLWVLPDVDFEWGPMVSLIALGVLGTGLAFVVAATLAGRVGGPRASILTYFMPIVSIALGVLFLQEVITAGELIGAAVLLVGAFATSRRERQTERSSVSV